MKVDFYTRKSREIIGISQAKLAEISGVKQYILSQHEMGKKDLSPDMSKQVLKVLNQSDLVKNIVQRKRRRTTHVFGKTKNVSRFNRYAKTHRNDEYIKLINRSAEKECNFTAISFFSGVGGFSLGFQQAGFKILGNVEINEKVRKIYTENFPSSRYFASDIRSVKDNISNILTSEQIKLDVIIGGPPCQGFSLSGKRNESDPRNSLFRDYCKQVDLIKPKFAIMENVRRLTSMKDEKGRLVVDQITQEFSDIGYRVEKFEVNASNYGVPQNRERIFFVAVRKDLNIEPFFPPVTHACNPSLFEDVDPQFTFGDAVSDLPFLEAGQASEVTHHVTVNHPDHVIRWLWDVPQGRSAHDNEDPSLRPPSGYNTTYKRQVWDEPAATVQTTFSMISGCRNVHPIATRSLTIKEAARIQTFPDSFKFTGTKGGISTGIGNAVPPLLSRAIASKLKTYLV